MSGRMYTERRFIAGWLALTLAAAAVFGVACLLYLRLAPPLLGRLGFSVGEKLMEEALQYEEAGDYANARQAWEAAVASRFAGEQNRALSLKRLGAIDWMAGEYEAARPLLEAAAASPKAPLSAWEPLADTLLALEDYEALEKVIQDWRAMASARDHAEEAAKACYYTGRLALIRGEKEKAAAAFEEGRRLAPGGRNAAELGAIYYARGGFGKALAVLDEYLRHGASGGRAAWARRLRAKAAEKLEAAEAS
jgi:tetratricopeptide (TPR) repeat protein